MKALKIVLAVAAVLVLGGLVFAAFFLPDMMKDIAIKQVKENTGREITIEKIFIQPFGMTAEIRQAQLKEADGKTPFVSFSSVRASVSTSSLWKRALVLDKIEVRSPYVHVVRTGENTYNFTDIQKHMEERKKKQPQEKKSETKFSINNIHLGNGKVVFEDQGVTPRTVHNILGIELDVPFISTIPYMADKYVTPRLHAVINGAPLKVEGGLKPLKDSVEASIAVKLDRVNLPQYYPYIPGDPPVRPESGFAGVDLVIAYTAFKHRDPSFQIAGNAGLDNVYLRDRTGAPIFALKNGNVSIRRADLFSRVFDVNILTLNGFDIWLSRDEKGVWSHSRLTAGAKKEKEPEPEDAEKDAAGKKPMLVRVALTQVRHGAFHFSDAQVPGGFATDVNDITFDLGGYSTGHDVNAPFRLSFLTSKQETAAFEGELSPVPLAFHTSASLKGIKLQDYYPFAAPYLTAPIRGTADLSAQVDFNKETFGLKASDVDLVIRDGFAPFGTKDGAKLGTFSVLGGSYDQEQNKVEIRKVALEDGDVKLGKDRDGNLTVNRLIKPQKRKGASVKAEKAKAEKPIGYKVDLLAVNRVDLTFTDDSLQAPRPPVFRLKKIDAGIQNITGPKFSTMPYRFASGYGNGGAVKLSGTLLPTPLKVTNATKLTAIPIKDFEPYMNKAMNLTVTDGLLSTDLKADLAKKGGEMTGTFKGNATVRSLHTLDTFGNDLLVWEALRLEGVQGKVSPFALHINEVVLNEYFANIFVAKDGRVNLTQLAKKGDQPKKEQEKKGPPPDIKINTVTLQGGVLAFEDQSLEPRRYGTRFVKVGGRVSGLNSAPGTRAGIDLRGMLENHSPLRISGEMNPLSDPIYANVRVDFDDIELPRLTPYSATYLGYRIEQGKLHTDMNYRIENNRIDASNRILIDQLFFGEKVESEKATSLPVPAAVGLLKDRKGQIELEVPVSGRTDDPKFSFGDAIRQAIKGTFSKLFTNPFAFLGAGGEEFRTIYFEFGKSALSDNEKKKLDSLAGKLDERPGLKIDVMGFVDRERDVEPYRQHLVNEKLRMEKYLDTVKSAKDVPPGGQIPDNIRIEPNEYSKYLKRAYQKADFPKPRKSLPDEEMRKLLLAHTIVGQAELTELSRMRSLVVRDYLAAKGKVEQARMFLKVADIFAEPGGSAKGRARVEFGLAGVKND